MRRPPASQPAARPASEATRPAPSRARGGSRRIAVAALGLSAAGVTQAIEPIKMFSFSVGPLVVRPKATVAQMYNDNLYYASGTQVDDFITAVTPSVELWLGRPGRDNFIALTYSLTSLTYAKNSAADSLDHSIRLSGTFKGQRLESQTSGSLASSSSIYGGYEVFQQGAAGGLSGNIDRLAYDFNERLTYKLSEKTGVYAQGNFNASDFSTGVPLYDLNTFRLTGGTGVQAFAKTKVFGEMYYGQSAASPNTPFQVKGPHASFVGGFLGIEGEFTPKLKGTVKAGFESFSFADNSPGSDSPVVEVGLTEDFSEKTQLTLSYARRTSVSVQYGNTAATYDVASLNLRQVIGTGSRLAATFGGSYGSYAYDQRLNQRRDDYLRLSIGLMYQIRLWLAAGFGYDFERLFSSDKAVVDYQVNRVTLSVVVGY